MKKQRPVNLDLQTISFPITAIASILHRVSGVITFIALAILLGLLATSLQSAEGYRSVVELVDNWFVKLIIWGILTALIYHIVVGVRHMIMDMGYGEDLQSANLSAKVAFVIAAVLALLVGGLVW